MIPLTFTTGFVAGGVLISFGVFIGWLFFRAPQTVKTALEEASAAPPAEVEKGSPRWAWIKPPRFGSFGELSVRMDEKDYRWKHGDGWRRYPTGKEIPYGSATAGRLEEVKQRAIWAYRDSGATTSIQRTA